CLVVDDALRRQDGGKRQGKDQSENRSKKRSRVSVSQLCRLTKSGRRKPSRKYRFTHNCHGHTPLLEVTGDATGSEPATCSEVPVAGPISVHKLVRNNIGITARVKSNFIKIAAPREAKE